MAEQCTVSIEDSKQQQEQPATSHDASHPASPLSSIKSPSCVGATAVNTATTNADDKKQRTPVDDGSNDRSNDGASTPRTTCDHRSTTPSSGVTPLSLAGDDNDGVKKPYWLFSSTEEHRTQHQQQQHHLLRMDSNGSDDIDGSLRHEPDRQQLDCSILLETPALERVEISDGAARMPSTDTISDGRIGASKLATISDKLATVKPKRLSDEFFSADDDNDDEEDEDDEEREEEETKSNGRNAPDRNTMVDSEAQASLSEIKNLSITCCGKRKQSDEDDVREERINESVLRNGGLSSIHPSGSKDEELLPVSRNATNPVEPKMSVFRAIENTVDAPLEHQQQQQQHAAVDDDDEELLLDDVQSMDAIERRDFEQEGGFLIRNRSLISGDRLNLEFLNNTNPRPPSTERTQPEKPPSSENGSSVGVTPALCASSNTAAVEVIPTSSSCSSASACTAVNTRTGTQHTTTPTSSRYQHKHDPHHHHHHHHHNQHHQHPRDGKTVGKAVVSSTGSDSFSSSYNRETENNSTTKFAVNKLTRNLSASLANCNDKKHEPQDAVTGSSTTSPIASSFATSSSSASSSSSSSNYSLCSASAAGPGAEDVPTLTADAPISRECKPELADAFLNANSNDSVSSDRSLFGVHATEEETTLTVSDVQTKEDTHTHHDPCSTTSSTASYSSSSSPTPSHTTTAPHNDDVPMVICSSSVLPPTASHSASSSVSSTHEETTSANSKHLCDGDYDEEDQEAKVTATKVTLAEKSSTSAPSSCSGRSTKEDSLDTNGKLSFSCAFPKEDGRISTADGNKHLLPSTSSNGNAQQEEQDVTSKARGNGTEHQPHQHAPHHHRRQFHHHNHRAAGAGNGTIAASSTSSSSRVVTANGSVQTGGTVVTSRESNPVPEVVVAPSFHQQRDASTNTSNSPESSEPEIDEEDWADCEEGTDEEVCTCRDYTDEDGFASSEDELPSRDVDLSSYTHLDTISDDLLHDAQTPRLHRKRKLTENRTILFGDSNSPSTESLNYSSRKRLALDGSTITATGSSSATANGGGSPGSATSATANATAASTGVTPLSNGGVSTTPRSSLRSPMNIITTPTSSTLGERKTPRTIIPTKDNPPPELNEWLMQFQRWTHVERLLAVDRLIEHCEPTQVRHMMKVIEPQFQRDFISLLPKELALQVLSYLEPKDLLRAAQTCRSWRFLADDNLLWKEKCKESGIGIEPSTDRPKRGRTGNMPPISSPWKAAYMRQHIIEMNWRSRPIRTAKVLKGHDDHVITCLQFCGNRIVSGSDDNTLKVWSAITGKCLRTLTGHTGGVWSSQMSGNIIISGSTDRTLRVWKADSGQCMHILHGHTSTVRCMHLHGNKVVSGSRDATLRVWDVNLGTCLHMLVGHLAAVRCVQYDGKLIVSGAYDYMVKVWNPERQECLHTLQGHTNRVYSLQFDGIHVVSGSLDTSIRVWDAETGSCKHALMGHQSLTSGMELRQNILVSGNADSTVKVWDIITGQCLQTLSGPNKHQSAVTCLQFNSRFVITSSDDGTVKLWDVKTGEFIRNLVALESGGSGGVVWRIRANDTKLICAVGSRNGTEETKLMVLDFDVEGACLKCS
ncbi:F-box/WD repeat-containing protein 7 [Anopheles funestus]|uniref:F-box/WD repeat-containing protein 7 n=1 Tax=Anopheles funestus TaxID=62324 RepID=UPI0020C6BC15|nr:F-box/WD repeat-containing protein 7 [Anopheles funestus]XP_049293679.1 F-box/WD repeat-containing protein 7 [Anopheles funestus]XP_049293680.1 F-box/WD repeat-containing protein 7 [Anopheles funestus]XP_049293681.1 F-box/WD repeat-containing protein 7 [Anopheles funestus]XP_049293682.1 F-box/WD repeat-containing protein 7 [Anopheles funestus]XP_049293683.1 F-box/WD repeat-containing protein 7 [Anopheles funestus]